MSADEKRELCAYCLMPIVGSEHDLCDGGTMSAPEPSREAVERAAYEAALDELYPAWRDEQPLVDQLRAESAALRERVEGLERIHDEACARSAELRERVAELGRWRDDAVSSCAKRGCSSMPRRLREEEEEVARLEARNAKADALAELVYSLLTRTEEDGELKDPFILGDMKPYCIGCGSDEFNAQHDEGSKCLWVRVRATLEDWRSE